MYTVVGNVRSRTIRVLWLLEELGVEYEFRAANPRSEEALAHTSAGKVPVLLDAGHAFSDSVAIMTYLSDKHQKFTNKPGTPERATQDGHTFFLLDEFDACLWTASRHSYVLPEHMRLPEIVDSLKWEFERSRDRFVQRLDGRSFLMGDNMTIADILAAHCARWATNISFPVEQPEFKEYLDRMLGRPAFKRALKAK